MGDVLFLSAAEIRRLLPPPDAIEVMAEALAAMTRGEATNPLRTKLWTPGKEGLLGMMPAHLAAPPLLGIKVVTVFPGAHEVGLDSHQGAVLLFEAEHGAMLAILDAAALTAIRTAAVSALATRLLAREGTADLAILGAGVQAWSHLVALAQERPLTRVRVWSRTRARAETLAQRAQRELGETVEVAPSAEAAVTGAEIVCTVTTAREPVLSGAWLAPGAHVNAVGSSTPAAQEIDGETVARSRVFADRRESALVEAGDLLGAVRDGAIEEIRIEAELGEVLLGRHPGRESEDEITLFESLGLGVEDLGAAWRIYERAVAAGAGTRLDLGDRG